ncbi:MAG: hypothetical protein DMF76_03465 [Acidobacteria bacterium]|nr:MAG: hypothetical protein DMF76_03465 [Acidobacteriota bacterium]
MISAQTARRAVWRPLWQLPRRFDLIVSLTKRELAARYRGSVLGILWAILTPVVMIAIFTIIFAGIFKAKFGASSSQWDYALYLFCGLLPWNAFQEALQLSANTIVSHANLVKRVVFPLETLPVSLSLAAIANQLFGTAALIVAALLLRREIHVTILFPGFIGSFRARHRSGRDAGFDGVDVPHAHHLSRIPGSRPLSHSGRSQSFYAFGAQLSANHPRREPSGLAGLGLLYSLRNSEFCFWVLVVRANSEELCRCDLTKLAFADYRLAKNRHRNN